MENMIFTEGNHRYLRLRIQAGRDQGYKVRMLNTNEPELLLAMHAGNDENGGFYDYHISGMSSLAEEEESGLMEQLLYSVVFSLEKLGDVLTEYLLNPEEVLLAPEYVFLNKMRGEPAFVYCPGASQSLQTSLQELMSFFMRVLKPSREEDILLLYGLYQCTRESYVTMGDLAAFWRSHQGDTTPIVSVIPEEKEVRTEYEPRGAKGREQEIFQELGLEGPTEETGFAAWKKKREEERLPVAPSLETSISDEKEDVLDLPPWEEDFKPPIQQGKDLFEKLKPKLIQYRFEIIIGLVVMGGVLFLLVQ